jgi:uncharacterized protein YkwD
MSRKGKTVSRPSPRVWKLAGVLAGVVATVFAMGALTACGGRPSGAGVGAGATGSAVPVGSVASVSAEPYPLPSAPVTAGLSTPSSPPTSRPAAASPAKPKSAPKPAPPQPGVSAIAQAVLDQTNAWRTAAGLKPYVMLTGLVASAHKHNLTMAAGCGLSHQCPGEAPFGDRIQAEGVRWNSAGENCGVGGAANNQAAITAAAKGLNQAMFNEKPPSDGHRRNLLSSSFTHIGIDVVRDSKGSVWLTEDFTS